MGTFKAQFKSNDDFKLNLQSKDSFNLDHSEAIYLRNDYDKLKNKPSINGVTLEGDKTSSQLKIIYKGTKEYWNNQSHLVAENNALYVYTDYQEIDNGDGTFTIVPAIKIGDGTSYLIDMPFAIPTDPRVLQHITDNTIHVTAEEKEFWNNKWAGFIDPNNLNGLIFTKDNIPLIY